MWGKPQAFFLGPNLVWAQTHPKRRFSRGQKARIVERWGLFPTKVLNPVCPNPKPVKKVLEAPKEGLKKFVTRKSQTSSAQKVPSGTFILEKQFEVTNRFPRVNRTL